MASASTCRDRGEKVTLKYYVRLERESVLGHVTRADVSRSPPAPCYGAGPSVARRSLLLARELSSLLVPFFLSLLRSHPLCKVSSVPLLSPFFVFESVFHLHFLFF